MYVAIFSRRRTQHNFFATCKLGRYCQHQYGRKKRRAATGNIQALLFRWLQVCASKIPLALFQQVLRLAKVALLWNALILLAASVIASLSSLLTSCFAAAISSLLTIKSSNSTPSYMAGILPHRFVAGVFYFLKYGSYFFLQGSSVKCWSLQ